MSCGAILEQYLGSTTGPVVMTMQDANYGWDPTTSGARTVDKFGNFDDADFYSSFLVKLADEPPAAPEFPDPAVVPIPAAAWLFGTALLGFFGVSRRQKQA
jgi:hypothetical protein